MILFFIVCPVRARGELLVIASCLPERLTPDPTSYTTAPEAQVFESSNSLRPSKGEMISSAIPAMTSKGGSDEWEEVRADGVYSLNLNRGENVRGGDCSGCWVTPSPELHPWSSSRVGGSMTPPDSDNGKSYTSDDDTRPRVQGEKEEERGGKNLNDSAKRGGQEEGPSASNDKNGTGEEIVSRAAMGLFSKLKDSIHRRVHTIPSSAAPRAVWYERGDDCIDTGDVDVGAANQETRREVATTAISSSEVARVVNDSDKMEPMSDGPVVARVGVLFSGGLDSVVLAAMLAERWGGTERAPTVPEGEAIDLINVCFDR